MKFFKSIIALVTLFTMASCSTSNTSLSSNSDVSSQRAPASVSGTKANLWGKPVTDSEVDFLDDLENSPSDQY